MSKRSPVARAREEGFLDGVILALQVISAAGDMGGATYEEILLSAGAVDVYRRAESEGMLVLSGLCHYVAQEGHARSEALRITLAAQQGGES